MTFNSPNSFICFIKELRPFSSGSKLIIILFDFNLCCFPFILLIMLIFFSIFIQSSIREFNSFSFHLFSINFPFSNDNLILLGSFSISLIRLSSQYWVLTYFSTSFNK